MIKIATVFSGIGSVEYALKKMNLDHEIVFACDNGERELPYSDDKIKSLLKNKSSSQKKIIIDQLYEKEKKPNFVKQSYMSNYSLDDANFYQDVRYIDGKQYKEKKIDLFVGGSPCQSFSQCGKQLGFNDIRGTLFFEFARLVKETQPKVYIYENVPGILTHDNGFTWKTMSNIFNDLPYVWDKFILNARDYGIPQNRKRVFVIGIKNTLGINRVVAPNKIPLEKNASDFYDEVIDNKYYHGYKGFQWISNPKHIGKRVGINNKITRTQTANQQFNWCGDMIFENIEETKCNLDGRVYAGYFQEQLGVFRKLTPRECLRLMGYDDSFRIVVKDVEIYRQAGNSIVVNIFERIILKLCELGLFENEN